jgi:hypothetical protein
MLASTVHLAEIFVHSVKHSDRLGSIPKYLALHAATHDACFVSHSAAPTQASQPPVVCAAMRWADIHPTSVRMKMAIFTIFSWFGASPGQGQADGTLAVLLAPGQKFVAPCRRTADRSAL